MPENLSREQDQKEAFSIESNYSKVSWGGRSCKGFFTHDPVTDIIQGKKFMVGVSCISFMSIGFCMGIMNNSIESRRT